MAESATREAALGFCTVAYSSRFSSPSLFASARSAALPVFAVVPKLAKRHVSCAVPVTARRNVSLAVSVPSLTVMVMVELPS